MVAKCAIYHTGGVGGSGSNPLCSTQGLAEMQVLFRFYKRFLQDSGVKGFMFVNDVKVLTTFLTTT